MSESGLPTPKRNLDAQNRVHEPWAPTSDTPPRTAITAHTGEKRTHTPQLSDLVSTAGEGVKGRQRHACGLHSVSPVHDLLLLARGYPISTGSRRGQGLETATRQQASLPSVRHSRLDRHLDRGNRGHRDRRNGRLQIAVGLAGEVVQLRVLNQPNASRLGSGACRSP